MRSRRGLGSAAILALLGSTALAAPWLGLRDPAAQPDGLVLRERPPMFRARAAALRDGTLRFGDVVRALPDGSAEIVRSGRSTRIPAEQLRGTSPRAWLRRPLYVLGTDGYGRDLLSRLVFGARTSLAVGVVAAGMALALGTLVGLTAGLAGGLADGLLMRTADVFLSIPRLFLILFLLALHGPSRATTVLVLAATTWMAAARLVRAEVLSLRERDWVRAARAAGASSVRIAARHVLPGAAGPLLVEGALRLGSAVLLEASLSFLGLGIPPPAPSWGNIIADGRDRLLSAPWIATLPGLAIAATVAVAARLADLWSESPVRGTGATGGLTSPGTSRTPGRADPQRS